MITGDVAAGYLDAIEAQVRLGLSQLQLALAQVEAMRHHVARTTPAGSARVDVPDACLEYAASKCMRRDGEPAACGLSEMCRACGVTRDVK